MQAGQPFLDVEVQEHVAVVRLNRPERRNALSEPGVPGEFEALVDRLNQDMEVRVAILTGAGTAFSSGGNVKTMLARNGPGSGPVAAVPGRYASGIQRVTRALFRLNVPVIAAINGAATGAGLDLACMCDMRIAARSARLAESFIRLGIVPGDGGAWVLPRLIGDARAREMAFTGDAIDADTALAWGLVSQVVDDAGLMPAAMALAARVARNAPYQLRFTKQLFRDCRDMDLDRALEMSGLYQAMSHWTEDHAEGVAAALDKRMPVFKGH
ncbi:crotonase/enoyl-CoA hydratase family protein [Verticiella sediminum]|uniref:Crotonase/enoyl-CoA hydratase family protein n=2 Tax=Verticiella sediminum TaxID=1247510 RepID=A0A556AD24_9BURK|nr:crotonase/enoyl-CoA hydratase family protein [Verticiella sediminum]